VTFIFDDERVLDILEKETKDPKTVEKLMNNLEKIGNSIILLESDDGINWRKTGIIVAKDGSVPNLVVDYEGRLRLYYVSFRSYSNKWKIQIIYESRNSGRSG
jgi:hypothetical protein